MPGQRQTRVLEEFLCRQIARLAPVEDGLRDVRGEIAEANQPREIGRPHPFTLGQCGRRHPGVADEGGVEPARPDQQLDQPRVTFRCGKRAGARCLCQASGKRACANSFSAVRSRSWRPSRMACVMSGAR